MTTPNLTENHPRVVFERLFGEGGTTDAKVRAARSNGSTRWSRQLFTDWDPKRDFSFALLHAERLTRMPAPASDRATAAISARAAASSSLSPASVRRRSWTSTGAAYDVSVKYVPL